MQRSAVLLNSEEFKEVLLYDANPHGRKLFIFDEQSQPRSLCHQLQLREEGPVVYDEALNNVEEVHYDAVTHVCYDAVLSLNYISSSILMCTSVQEIHNLRQRADDNAQ